MTHIGNNRYSDGSHDVAVMIANGNSLTLTFADNELTLGVKLQKNSGVAKADIPVCGVQSNGTTLVLDDEAPGNMLQFILSKLSQ